MLFILNNITEPYFNIAAEEYLLRNFSDDIFMLYRNQPSIIVGKHQNAFAEINYWFVKEKNIKVVRRLSGGGTVFHDLGNLNFTFIQNGKEGALIDFVKFTEPILQTLLQLGVPASRSGRNDLLANGFKISGNAEHVYKNRTLHHGTLLFSSKLDDLKLGLNTKRENFTDKAVKSVPSAVTNISEYIPNMGIEEFIEKIHSVVKQLTPGATNYEFNETDTLEITKLVQEKYSKWEWNLGYSPKFTLSRRGIINNQAINIELEIDKGQIMSIQTTNRNSHIQSVLAKINGQLYHDELLNKELQKLIPPEEIPAWIKLLF